MFVDAPDVEKNQLSGALHVELISQLFEEVMERGGKLLAGLRLSRGKEKHQDSVLQAHDDLTLCVQLILILVVLHKHPINKQVHHDEMTGRKPEQEQRN